MCDKRCPWDTRGLSLLLSCNQTESVKSKLWLIMPEDPSFRTELSCSHFFLPPVDFQLRRRHARSAPALLTQPLSHGRGSSSAFCPQVKCVLQNVLSVCGDSNLALLTSTRCTSQLSEDNWISQQLFKQWFTLMKAEWWRWQTAQHSPEPGKCHLFSVWSTEQLWF